MGPARIQQRKYSHRYYNDILERLAPIMPESHWSVEQTLPEEYLAVACQNSLTNAKGRNKYCPGGEMWVTKSINAGGGDTWDSTYIDMFRTLNELGDFATITSGMISQMEFVRRVDVQTETIERYVREGLLVPDLVVPVSERRTFKYFNEETLKSTLSNMAGHSLMTPTARICLWRWFVRWM